MRNEKEPLDTREALLRIHRGDGWPAVSVYYLCPWGAVVVALAALASRSARICL